MNKKELDNYLFQLNEREIYYRDTQHPISQFLKQFSHFDINGQTVYRFSISAFNMDSLGILILKCNRFTPITASVRDYLQLHYVYSGEASFHFNDRTIILKKGALSIVGQDIILSADPPDENTIIIAFSISKDFFQNRILKDLKKNSITGFLINVFSDSATHENYMIFSPESKEHFHDLITSLLCEYFTHSICYETTVTAYLLLVFSELICSMNCISYNHKHNTDQSKLADILFFMEKNCLTCTLEGVAEQFHFNPSYLSRFIKKMTGSSYLQIIQTQKMLIAGQLLKSSDISVYEIANEIGYHNLTFFYKKFSNFYHMTPLEYRKNSNSLYKEEQ